MRALPFKEIVDISATTRSWKITLIICVGVFDARCISDALHIKA